MTVIAAIRRYIAHGVILFYAIASQGVHHILQENVWVVVKIILGKPKKISTHANNGNARKGSNIHENVIQNNFIVFRLSSDLNTLSNGKKEQNPRQRWGVMMSALSLYLPCVTYLCIHGEEKSSKCTATLL